MEELEDREEARLIYQKKALRETSYSPWGHEESDTTERLHFHFSPSCIGGGKWQPTPVFLPGESQDSSDLAAAAAACEKCTDSPSSSLDHSSHFDNASSNTEPSEN